MTHKNYTATVTSIFMQVAAALFLLFTVAFAAKSNPKKSRLSFNLHDSVASKGMVFATAGNSMAISVIHFQMTGEQHG